MLILTINLLFCHKIDALEFFGQVVLKKCCSRQKKHYLQPDDESWGMNWTKNKTDACMYPIIALQKKPSLIDICSRGVRFFDAKSANWRSLTTERVSLVRQSGRSGLESRLRCMVTGLKSEKKEMASIPPYQISKRFCHYKMQPPTNRSFNSLWFVSTSQTMKVVRTSSLSLTLASDFVASLSQLALLSVCLVCATAMPRYIMVPVEHHRVLRAVEDQAQPIRRHGGHGGHEGHEGHGWVFYYVVAAQMTFVSVFSSRVLSNWYRRAWWFDFRAPFFDAIRSAGIPSANAGLAAGRYDFNMFSCYHVIISCAHQLQLLPWLTPRRQGLCRLRSPNGTQGRFQLVLWPPRPSLPWPWLPPLEALKICTSSIHLRFHANKLCRDQLFHFVCNFLFISFFFRCTYYRTSTYVCNVYYQHLDSSETTWMRRVDVCAYVSIKWLAFPGEAEDGN